MEQSASFLLSVSDFLDIVSTFLTRSLGVDTTNHYSVLMSKAVQSKLDQAREIVEQETRRVADTKKPTKKPKKEPE
jgi:hypothetical protein